MKSWLHLKKKVDEIDSKVEKQDVEIRVIKGAKWYLKTLHR